MFASLSSFSIFFFSVASLLLIGILFEEKFLALEDKYDAYLERKKKQKRHEQARRFQAQKNCRKSVTRPAQKQNSCKNRGYAA